MIEREIQVPEERRLAAAVIYNRLAAGDTLGIDATIRYEDGNYDEQLTESRLAEDTPYNTRVNPGLPPTPIGNPGLASIEAAANPAKSDAYYFVVKPGTCGEHVFVETEAGVRGGRGRLPAGARGRGRLADGVLRSRAPARGPRPAGLAFTLAGDAERGARRARPRRRVELRGDRGRARRFRGPRPLARRSRASPASTSPSRTSSPRWRSPTARRPRRARSAPRTRSASPTPGSRPRTPTPPA